MAMDAPDGNGNGQQRQQQQYTSYNASSEYQHNGDGNNCAQGGTGTDQYGGPYQNGGGHDGVSAGYDGAGGAQQYYYEGQQPAGAAQSYAGHHAEAQQYQQPGDHYQQEGQQQQHQQYYPTNALAVPHQQQRPTSAHSSNGGYSDDFEREENELISKLTREKQVLNQEMDALRQKLQTAEADAAAANKKLSGSATSFSSSHPLDGNGFSQTAPTAAYGRRSAGRSGSGGNGGISNPQVQKLERENQLLQDRVLELSASSVVSGNAVASFKLDDVEEKFGEQNFRVL